MKRIKSLRIRNFKAIRDTGEISLTDLTVLIGNNGSGKSSLIEALETYKSLITSGLDTAMQRWKGFEHIRNQQAKSLEVEEPEDIPDESEPDESEDLVSRFGHADENPQDPMKKIVRGADREPIAFSFVAEDENGIVQTETLLNISQGGNKLFIQYERFAFGETEIERDEAGRVIQVIERDKDDGTIIDSKEIARLTDDQSLVSTTPQFSRDYFRLQDYVRTFAENVERWQFALLNPDSMGNPYPRSRAKRGISLARDGSNIAEYLLEISEYDRENETFVLEGLVETLQYVLPYADDLRTEQTSELERSVYLQLNESGFKVSGLGSRSG